MVLLRMRAAGFDGAGASVGPLTLDVRAGERAALTFPTAAQASLAAKLAAGIVKATFGSVAVDDFDTRVQSAHCKRAAAFVGHDPLSPPHFDFERYVLYRAALWNVDPAHALATAQLAMERLEGVHEAFAYPLAAALISNPKLLVLDRPPAVYAQQIVDAAGPRAMLTTHGGARDAAAFDDAAVWDRTPA
ncbi:MAG TPA: hypothetical protein VMF61_15010 [Candidatus Acidoferrales bacterium]|nr:hypothetical protein [Candidatus Acidoferrales bacterium]